MNQARRVRVFLNEGSGSGGITREQSSASFAAHGCRCEVTVLRPGLNLEELAARDDAEVVWVASGGDGTVNAVAQVAAETGRVMGVLPLGTLNHFAKDLGLPMEMDEAVAAVANGEVRTVDAAEVNGVVFVNNSSLGVYPAMVLDRERMKKRGWNKWGSLAMASAKAFVRFGCLDVELEVDGKARHCRTPLLFVGNNAYAVEAGRIGRRERLDGGRLSVLVVTGATRLGMLRLLAAALVGRARQVGELEEFTVQRFCVRARAKHLRVALDGEVRRLAPPLEYRTRAGALHVIAPAGDAQ